MRRTWKKLVAFSLLFTACSEQPKTPQPTPLSSNSKAQILNNIVVHEKGGLTITRAYLSDANGNLLNAQNGVKENDTVLLNLVVKEGWLADHGKVSIGASQEITTVTGESVLSSSDLFAGQPNFPVAKADFLQLQTVITKARSDTREFVIHYRIWDKHGPGEVTGSYQLFLKAAVAK